MPLGVEICDCNGAIALTSGTSLGTVNYWLSEAGIA